MSLQTIVDKAQEIEIDRRRVIGQTMSRSQRLKTSERSTAQPWRMIVTPPGVLPWASSRDIVEAIDAADRVNETEITLSNTAGLSWITAYQGDLTTAQLGDLTVYSVSTTSMALTTLPSIGSTLTSRTYNLTAQSFAPATSATYNRAISSTRSDFLITNAEYDANYQSIKVGDTLNTSTYIASSQTIASITYNYITLAGTGYTRIVMSADADASSPAATVNGGNNITVVDSFSTTVSSSTYIFKSGDLIQPENSRYPYTVVNDVVRGSNTTTNVTLHRPLITSESAVIVGQGLNIANDCTWRMVVVGLPSYKLIPGRFVQYTGNFELIEKIV